MIQVLSSVWALLVGIVFIMLGNGMQFTLIGLRGDIEGFSPAQLAVITSGYFAGFLLGAQGTPRMIRRVGHVRVFAALGSFMSAGLIAFPLLTDPIAWTVLRLLVGFCMSGVYVTAESWLNDASTNATRGKVLSAYMIAQTLGLIGAQGLLTLGDAATSVLFIGASILVSVSFAPILLSVSPVPAAAITRPMSLPRLFSFAPLSTVGILILGGSYSTLLGMGAVFGTQAGLSRNEIALFAAMPFAGALLLQYPIGWLSDRIDRRLLITGCAVIGTAASALGWIGGDDPVPLFAAAFIAGGVTTPLYALFLAYTNDYITVEDMPAASGGLVFTFGIGAIGGPFLTGWAMQAISPYAYWLALAPTFAAIALYAAWRMTRRDSVQVSDTESYLGVLPSASPVAVEAAGAWAVEQAEGGDALG
ncbi:MFS transporter [Salipiger aestuarii]|uniref:Putative MFS family arabinose efflux permease n=1 Tax=Salipiger aestuarii TaxID=568098 RepID=A0A327YLP6_9RHOB|nr:MFS transporter [Salipiger aestuarii]KAA8610342.1 MFS transporter [Salipiger aestuarii]KAB2543547.1 MFS transporter [Salipiger aestuarii]RAK21883.1 putative MFS family arabinose efflux permease [Salipiger aestuarii]